METGGQEHKPPEAGERGEDASPTRERALDLLRRAGSVFIAYSHADLRAAHAFRKRVVGLRKGLPPESVFLDQESLTPGSIVSPADIERRLGASDLFVVICGADTADRVHVNREVDEALRQRETRGLAILPVILKAGVPLPPGLDFRVQGIFLAALFPDDVRRRRVRRALVALGLALLVTAAGVAVRNRVQQQVSAREARSQRLTAQAREMLDADPQLAVLLAVEAVRATAVDGRVLPPAQQGLREALNASYGYGLGSHAGRVRALAFTPDGRRLVTASDDGTARLWEVAAHDPARPPLVLRGHTAPLTSLAIDASGRLLVTGSDDGTVRTWNLAAGDPSASSTVLTSRAPSGRAGISAVAVTPDARRVVATRGTAAWVWQIDGATPSEPIAELGHPQAIESLAMSPDGRWIATEDCDAALWEINAADVHRTRRRLAMPTGCAKALAFSPDSRWLVTGSQDNVARLWDLTRRDPGAPPVQVTGFRSGLTSFRGIDFVAVLPGNRWLLTGYGDGSVQMWDWQKSKTPEPGAILGGHKRRVQSVATDARGKWLATVGEDATVRLWAPEVEDPDRQSSLLSSHANISAFAIGPDRWMASGGWDGTVRLARLPPDPIEGGAYSRRGSPTAISADSRLAASVRLDGALLLWDLSTDHPTESPTVLPGHKNGLSDLALSPDGRWLATASYDGTSFVWDLRAEDVARSATPLRNRGERVNRVFFGEEGRRLFVAGEDGTVVVRDLTAPAATEPRVIRHANGRVIALASRNGRWLVTGSNRPPIQVWSLDDEARAPISLGAGDVFMWPLMITGDSRWLLAGSEGHHLLLWDLNADEPARSEVRLEVSDGDSFALDASEDGRRLVTGGHDGVVRLWDLTAPDPAAAPRILGRHEAAISRVVVGHGDRRLITMDENGLVRLWDLTAADVGRSAIDLRGHEAKVTALGETSDGRWLVTGDEGGVVRLWDLGAKDIAASVGTLPTHGGAVTGVAISPDGQWVMTDATDTSVRLSNLSLDRMLRQARESAGRNLRPEEWGQYFPGESYRATFPDLEAGGARADGR
jgi:WD40 repeat protein